MLTLKELKNIDQSKRFLSTFNRDLFTQGANMQLERLDEYYPHVDEDVKEIFGMYLEMRRTYLDYMNKLQKAGIKFD